MISHRLTRLRAALLSVILALTGCAGSSVSKPDQSAYLKKQEQILQADLSRAEASYKSTPQHSGDELGTALFRLANNYMQQGRFGQSESLLRRSLQLSADRGRSPSALDLTWLGFVCLKQRKFQESEQFLRKALSAQELWEKESKVAPEADSQLQGILGSLGTACMEQKKFADAESIFKRNLGISERQKEKVSPIYLPSALGDLAWLYARTGRNSEAGPLFERAVAIQPNAHTLTTQAEICEHYAEFLRSQGKTAESTRMLAKAKEYRSRQSKLNPDLDY